MRRRERHDVRLRGLLRNPLYRAFGLVAVVAVALGGCTRTSAPPQPKASPAPEATHRQPATSLLGRTLFGATDAGSQARLEVARGPAPVPQTEHERFPNAPVLALPHAKPVIYNIMVSPTAVHAGETVVGTVTTTSNVASVVATVRGLTVDVPRVGYGRFALAYRLPAVIPPAFNGTYALKVIARNVDGTEASRSVDVTLH